MNRRISRVMIGAVVGALTGSIVAVNLVIFSGAEEGYETSITEVFDRSALLGILVVLVVLAGPIVGGFVASRRPGRSVAVREANPTDIGAMATFFREAWAMTGPDAPGWAGADDDVIDELTRPDVLEGRLGGPERRMFIALEGDRIVGFSATRWDGEGPAELAGIVVLQEMVGQGIGTPLLDAAITRLRTDGAATVFVRTEADNTRALGFYRSRGFGEEATLTETVEGVEVVVTELRREL